MRNLEDIIKSFAMISSSIEEKEQAPADGCREGVF